MYRTKMIRAETKVIDEEQGLVTAIVSTEGKDRDGDIIRASGWNMEHFKRHPVLLASHDYTSLKSQIGHWEDMDVKGKKLQGTAKYYIGAGNEEADWGFELAKRSRAAYSVGFVPDMDKARQLEDGKGLEFRGQELLEVSHVTIPSNPEALQRMKALHPVIDELVDEMLPKGARKQSLLDNDDIDYIVDEIYERLKSHFESYFVPVSIPDEIEVRDPRDEILALLDRRR